MDVKIQNESMHFFENILNTKWFRSDLLFDKKVSLQHLFAIQMQNLYEECSLEIHNLIYLNKRHELIRRVSKLISEKLSRHFIDIIKNCETKYLDDEMVISDAREKVAAFLIKLKHIKNVDKERYHKIVDFVSGYEVVKRFKEFINKKELKKSCFTVLPVLLFSSERKLKWKCHGKELNSVKNSDVRRTIVGNFCVLPKSILVEGEEIFFKNIKTKNQMYFEEKVFFRIFKALDGLLEKKGDVKTSKNILKGCVKRYINEQSQNIEHYNLNHGSVEILKGCSFNAFGYCSLLLKDKFPKFNASLLCKDPEYFSSKLDESGTVLDIGLTSQKGIYVIHKKSGVLYQCGNENHIKCATYQVLWILEMQENLCWQGNVEIINIQIMPILSIQMVQKIQSLFGYKK